MNFTEKVPCPLCNSEKAETVRTIKDIVQCECGMVYLRTRPSVKELEVHYQRYASNPGSHMALPKTFDEVRYTGLRRPDVMRDILHYCGEERGRLLDIGSGWGAFLLGAREVGFTVQGVEICREMAEFAWNKLGIVTWDQQIEKLRLGPGSLQVVTLLHSLEHLPHLSDALQWMHKALKMGGLICGIVPNFDSWASNAMRDKWPWLDPEMHYSHMTQSTLQKALWQFGFNVVEINTVTGDFDRRLLPHFPPQLAELEKNGKGEEIHWVAVKM